jgi:NADH-quinone oxidoreductase subunit G
MNRCIARYRCVRYYKITRAARTWRVRRARHLSFGRVADGMLESEFAGNLVECARPA